MQFFLCLPVHPPFPSLPSPPSFPSLSLCLSFSISSLFFTWMKSPCTQSHTGGCWHNFSSSSPTRTPLCSKTGLRFKIQDEYSRQGILSSLRASGKARERKAMHSSFKTVPWKLHIRLLPTSSTWAHSLRLSDSFLVSLSCKWVWAMWS